MLVCLVSAQTSTTRTDTDTKSTTTTSTDTSTASTGGATHTVKVGPKEDPHQYVPHNITADVGDVVVFEFYPTNHSVVKADYMAPCVPASGEVFYSGAFDDFNENNGQLVGPVCTTEVCFMSDSDLDSLRLGLWLSMIQR